MDTKNEKTTQSPRIEATQKMQTADDVIKFLAENQLKDEVYLKLNSSYQYSGYDVFIYSKTISKWEETRKGNEITLRWNSELEGELESSVSPESGLKTLFQVYNYTFKKFLKMLEDCGLFEERVLNLPGIQVTKNRKELIKAFEKLSLKLKEQVLSFMSIVPDNPPVMKYYNRSESLKNYYIIDVEDGEEYGVCWKYSESWSWVKTCEGCGIDLYPHEMVPMMSE